MDTGTGSKKVPRQQELDASFHGQRAFLFISISLLSPARNSKSNSSGLNSKEITASQKWKSGCRVGFRVGWYNQPALSSMIQILSSFYHPEGQLHPKADSQWTMIVGCWMAGVWATCFLENIFFFTLSIYSWLHRIFTAVHGPSLVAGSGGALCHSAQVPHCGGFSCYGAWALWHTGCSRCGSRAWEFSSCSARARLLCGMCSLLQPGIKSMFPPLAVRFLTTGPPGNSPSLAYFKEKCSKALDTFISGYHWPEWHHMTFLH